jgi:hypothetical protein
MRRERFRGRLGAAAGGENGQQRQDRRRRGDGWSEERIEGGILSSSRRLTLTGWLSEEEDAFGAKVEGV